MAQQGRTGADRRLGLRYGLGSRERPLSRGPANTRAMAWTGGEIAWRRLAVLRNPPRHTGRGSRRPTRADASTDLVGSHGGVSVGCCVADRADRLGKER